MANVSISRRYARALLSVASEANRVDAVAQQLSALAGVLEKSPELTDVLQNPAYSRPQRERVVEALLGMVGGAEPTLANALRLLNDRNRLTFLPDIARVYRDMADAKAGRVRGQVVTATRLPDEVIARMQQQLTQLTRMDVVLSARVDPAVIGGVSAQVGGTLYDGTLRTQLEDLRRELKQR
ncbi:ATP synthase F1 subunit delta [Aggregicoccus sp. 17bor-14]|uniref:ATP synthase F1 subunit delta n=1 Tax=Myxococcaceae TaxID=31 RepID=UPI00129C2623|nr:MULTISPECIES: ATP synthase F1 subunit delta [Myxococcaceae]MBF5045907.1 ATP synthase F1 subunit delta [Simulacricoccus sp. 17bor-14]MRI91641.1 ATP synthase F1 subunit delta [Aggregicoccus sp. 17bor-14]